MDGQTMLFNGLALNCARRSAYLDGQHKFDAFGTSPAPASMEKSSGPRPQGRAMGVAVGLSRAQLGIEAPLVQVEVHSGVGLPSFNIVGLAETVVREIRDPVRSAIEHSGFDFPSGRVIVNLAPADLPKSGGRYDLPIALGILAAKGALPAGSLAGQEFYGELS